MPSSQHRRPLGAPARGTIDRRLSVGGSEAFERLAAEAGLALRLVGCPTSFEVVATPLRASLLDHELVQCVLRGRFVDAARGSWARARLLVRPYWRTVGRLALVTASADRLDLLSAGQGIVRLRRQQRVMLKMWSAALGPVTDASVDDPFRGMTGTG